MQGNEIARFTIAFCIVAASLLAFGFLYWKKPELVATELRLNRKNYPPEYKAAAREAYLRQIRSVGLGLIMGGFACIVLFVVLLIFPDLLQYMKVGS